MTDISWFTVTFLSRNQYRNLSCNIMAGFILYRAAHRNIVYRYLVSIHSENFMSFFSWPVMSFLSRLDPRIYLLNILEHHLGNILVYLSRFIPTFSLGTSVYCIEITSSPWIPLQTRLFTRLYSLTFSETCLYCWTFSTLHWWSVLLGVLIILVPSDLTQFAVHGLELVLL